MEFFKKILNKHWPILIAAFIIGLIIILPNILSIAKIGLKDFKGVYPIVVDDGEYYLARVKDLQEGFFLGNPFFKEHQNDIYLQPPLAEFIFARLSNLSHLSVPAFFAVSNFFLPFFGVIVLYILFYNITKSKYISIFFSFLYYLLFIREFGRILNPQFSFIFLIIGLIFIWRLFSERHGFKKLFLNNAIISLMFGLLIYMQPYFWTTLAALYGTVLFLNVCYKKEIIYYAKSFLLFLSMSLFLAIPYLLNQANLASQQPAYSESLLRFGMIFNHWPACYTNAVLLFLSFISLYFAKKIILPQKLLFSYASIICGFLLIWQNVITGKYIQFSGHYIFSLILMIFIVFAVIISSVYENIKNGKNLKYKLLVSLFIIISITGFLALRQARAINKNLIGGLSKTDMLNLQSQRKLFDWIKNNTEAGSVIFTPEYFDFLTLIPIYTNSYVYSYGYGGLYLMSDEEMEDRWIRQSIFEKNVDKDYIIKNSRAIWQNKFIDNYQNKVIREKIFSKLTGRNPKNIDLVPSYYVEKVFGKYNEVKKENSIKALKKFEINYIILDNSPKYQIVGEELKKYKEVKKMAEINGNVIYKLE